MKIDEKILEKGVRLRHSLHRHPELSGEEEWTRGFLMDFLRDNTDFEVVSRGSWFYAVKKRDPREAGADSPIAFRADFDALPIEESLDLPYASECSGVSHKCGHDGHAAALAVFAMALTGKPVSRTVCLIFQPAEEIGEGGEGCAALITEMGIREIYAFHNRSGYPKGMVICRDGLIQCASEGLTITFSGKTSHASEPELGANPSSALARLVLFCGEYLKRKHNGLVLCTIVNLELGNRDFGISPGEGSVSMTLRAEEEKELELLEQAILAEAESLAVEDGLKVSRQKADVFPETRNDMNCARRVRRAAKRLGRPYRDLESPWRASEDFGWYEKLCPGAMFYIGNGEEYPALHTKEYDFPDDVLEYAAVMFLELLENGKEVL